MPVLQPWNSTQVKNIRSKQLQKQRLSHDALYNLHELAVDLPDFVHAICTHPNLICICSNRRAARWVGSVGTSASGTVPYVYTPVVVIWHLSTGWFLCINTCFPTNCSRKPLLFQLPSLYMKESCRHAMMSCLAFAARLHMFTLKKTKKPMVTDEEQAYVNTIVQYLPAAAHLRCWSHVLKDAKRWFQSHRAPAQDVFVYLTDIIGLFHLPTCRQR